MSFVRSVFSLKDSEEELRGIVVSSELVALSEAGLEEMGLTRHWVCP